MAIKASLHRVVYVRLNKPNSIRIEARAFSAAKDDSFALAAPKRRTAPLAIVFGKPRSITILLLTVINQRSAFG